MQDSFCEPYTLWFGTALLPSGWADAVRITVKEGLIQRVEADAVCDADDERYAIGIAGAGNVHSHAFQRGIAGFTEYRRGADSFWSWREAMYGFVARLDPGQFEAIAAQAYVEMLESGITRVGEFHYLHHASTGSPYTQIAEHAQRIAAAAQHTGIGLTLLPVFYAHAGVGGQPPAAPQRRFINSLDSFMRLLDAARACVAHLQHGVVGVAAHSLRAVTPAELQELMPLAGSGPFHIHVAEQQDEVRQWQQWAGCRPVEWLFDHANIDARWCLVHATHVSDAELTRLAHSAATVGLCPITEANLGDGIFPAREYLVRGGRFGIGTDSNVLIDFAEELRLLEYGQRLAHCERNVLSIDAAGTIAPSTGRTLFDTALAAGAQALGVKTGRLAVDHVADVVALSDQHPALFARKGDALIDSWIFSGGRAVDTVWSAGRKVVSAGRHHFRETIADKYKVTLQQLLADV